MSVLHTFYGYTCNVPRIFLDTKPILNLHGTLIFSNRPCIDVWLTIQCISLIFSYNLKWLSFWFLTFTIYIFGNLTRQVCTGCNCFCWNSCSVMCFLKCAVPALADQSQPAEQNSLAFGKQMQHVGNGSLPWNTCLCSRFHFNPDDILVFFVISWQYQHDIWVIDNTDNKVSHPCHCCSATLLLKCLAILI